MATTNTPPVEEQDEYARLLMLEKESRLAPAGRFNARFDDAPTVKVSDKGNPVFAFVGVITGPPSPDIREGRRIASYVVYDGAGADWAKARTAKRLTDAAVALNLPPRTLFDYASAIYNGQSVDEANALLSTCAGREINVFVRHYMKKAKRSEVTGEMVAAEPEADVTLLPYEYIAGA